MSSTGNDIISLHAIDKERTRYTGFYSKILSAAEQGLYERLALQGLYEGHAFQGPFAGESPARMPFELFVWLLWSVKESAYKYLKRTEPGLIFSPTGIIVRQIDLPSGPVTNFEGGQWESAMQRLPGSAGDCPGERFCTGTVCHGSAVLYFRSTIHTEYIATVVAGEEGFDNVWWGVQRIDHPSHEHQSKMVRDLARQRLNAVCPGDELSIRKSPSGHPIVCKGDMEMKIPVSLAHHGCFVAYSLSTADLAGILPDEGLPSGRFLTTRSSRSNG